MKKSISLFIALILLAALTLTVFAEAIPQSVLDSAKGVFYVEVQTESGTASGTAFVVYEDNSSTYLITNYHVVADNTNNVSVWVTKDQSTYATVAASSKQNDLALIKIAQKLDVPVLSLSTAVQKGDEVYAVGFPAAADALSDTVSKTNDEATITNGIISSIRSLKITGYSNEVPILQINADINAGNSGGPLMNSKGEVIGVNAYSVTNSTGINGAIASSAVIDFIDKYGPFKVSSGNSSPFPFWAIILLIFVGYCVICGLIFFLIARKKRKTIMPVQPAAFGELPLSEYLRKLGRSLEPGEIAALMLPLALELREMHNQGRLSLQLSPRVLSVAKDGVKLTPNHPDSSGGLPMYMAPEQRIDGPVSAAIDIYSFSAVLSYLSNYQPARMTPPPLIEGTVQISNSEGVVSPPVPVDPQAGDNQTPLTDDIREQQNAWLQGIIDKGMQFDPAKRYHSFQEVIFALSSLNNGFSAELSAPLKADLPVVKAQKKMNWLLPAIAIALGVFIISLVGYQGYELVGLNKAVAADDFAGGKNCLARLIAPSILAPEQEKYVQAGSLLLDKKYDDAFNAFIELKSSYNAVNMALEAKYQKAAWLADSGSFDEAITEYTALGEYKDSSELIKKTTYRKGNYLISINEFSQAYNIFEKLSKDDYLDSKKMMTATNYAWGMYNLQNGKYLEAYQKLMLTKDYQDSNIQLDNLKIPLYKDAVEKYHSKNYTRALSEFSLLKDFLDSNDYIVLARAHSLGDSYPAGEILTDLAPLIGFEDAGAIIVSDFYFASNYLKGAWSGSDHYFVMANDGTDFNIPASYGDRIWIDTGTLYVYDHNQPDAKTPAFVIEPVSTNLILVYCYQNSQTYSLVRVATADEVDKYLAQYQ
jgi:V8-like Glu-specific endopeptidase